jgi:hypothetical protein
MLRGTFSERVAVKLTQYHAAKKATRKRRAAVRRKLKAKARLKEVLRLAREALGWKPGGPKGGKLSPEHAAALHAGRDRYHQSKREEKFSNTGGS